MPEGPEIWNTADALDEALTGREITDFYFAFDELKDSESKLKGQKITKVEARAKAILTYFENDTVMYSHNQLYGKWIIPEDGKQPDTNRSLRVAIHNKQRSAYLYSASDVELLSEEEVENHSYIKKLGPDVLHPNTTKQDITDQYFANDFKNRKLTTLLLDQGFVSGIGNYLRSEIMFYAGVNPRNKLRTYSDEQKEKLAEATYKLTTRSYETGGITNDPSIVEALKRENAPYSEYRHFVYNRTGDRCHKCGTVIEEEKNGGRKIYYCPSCQING